MIALPEFEKAEPTPQDPLYDAKRVIDRMIGRGQHDKDTGLYFGSVTELAGQHPVDMDIKPLEPKYDEHVTTYRYAVSMTVPSRLYGMVRAGFEIAAQNKATISMILKGIAKHPADFSGHFATNGYPSSASAFVFVASGVRTSQWDGDEVPGAEYDITPCSPARTNR